MKLICFQEKSVCARSLLKELTLCLTSARDMKRCQRERQVSFVLGKHTHPNNTATTPPGRSERIHSAAVLSGGGGLWAFGALRCRQLACVWVKPRGASLLKVTRGADFGKTTAVWCRSISAHISELCLFQEDLFHCEMQWIISSCSRKLKHFYSGT